MTSSSRSSVRSSSRRRKPGAASNETATLPVPAEKPVKAEPAPSQEKGQVVALDAFRKR